MTISETLKDVKFVVGADGQPTAALVDISAWQHVVDLLEEAEDQGLLRAYLTRRRAAHSPEALGLISWEQAEAELDAREERGDAPVG
ncbi:MAG: hypothetical protein WCF99_00100 [Chloroflexales bacterium]|jgi:hypothetical protein